MQVPHIPPAGTPELAGRLKQKIDRKTKPLGALGMLETLALHLGMIQGTESPHIHAPHLLVFAGDHGVAAEGVSAYRQEVTWQMVMNYLAGGAAVNVFARPQGLAVDIVDAGVNHVFEPHPHLLDRKIGMGTKNFSKEPAMTVAQCEAALEAGSRGARSLSVLGCNLLALGEMGIGNTTAAAALMARFTGMAAEGCIGRGTGVDDAGLARKREVIRQALVLHRAAVTPIEALASFGGFEIAMMAGAMLGAAQERMIILVDGFIAGSALLAAQAIAPGVLDYCVFAHQSEEAGHVAMLRHFHAEPLLKLRLRLGEGSGAALALPLVRAACDFINQMASFESAGVADQVAARP
ncbi:MAG TPA: nicotinate-nucleotide--dimethylbenzimidazole phosphoribosyltransferase [Burkholderiales bacterium]|jgi:nicotinate-nucleotide--dimethylbenzimidazole phosphoribosyltransferase|nr:nicotinate-nucleotide--dimethylbenzimidazole phosphoribosyltransferase [Burkholderiales bacterium]